MAFWSWNLDIVAFSTLKKHLGITMPWLICLHFSMPWCFSPRISMSRFFGLGISMSWFFGLGISMSWLFGLGISMSWPRSFKTAIYGTFARRMRKDVRYCFHKKIMTSAAVEIRIAFLICYLQSLYEIELGHYFCPEFVGHVTNQNILVDAGKLM